jgi:hypothetical protein
MKGILFSQMEPPSDLEEAFHEWYNKEHIPLRLALPGIDKARRFEAPSGKPRFLAVYEVSDLGVFDTEQFHSLKNNPSERTRRMLENATGFTRYLCERISDTGPSADGDYLSVNAFQIPDADIGLFDDWYETEHIPRLMQARDWLRVRRYRVYDGDGPTWTHLALHDLVSTEVMDSPERRFARTGPKRDILVNKPWFIDSGRWLYRVIFDTEGP